MTTLLRSPAAAQEDASEDRHVIILADSASAAAAVSHARQLSAQLGLLFGTRGMIVDRNGKLRWPVDWTDKLYAGSYFHRRLDIDCVGDNTIPTPTPLGHCITVEKASAYGWRGKKYVIVAGIVGDDEAATRLQLIRQKVPTARDHHALIDMSCVH